jgi:hypothetical protein
VPTFRIADVPFNLTLPRSAWSAALLEAWSAFEASADTSSIAIHVEDTRRPAAAPEHLMPSLMVREDGALAISGSDFEATVSADRSTVSLSQAPGRFGIESVVKVLLADRLLSRGGLLLHSVGVASAERAGLFVGHSGAGKSTLGALADQAGLSRLADELVAVVPDSAGGFRAHGTPWNVGRASSAALRMVGCLEWGASPPSSPGRRESW